MKSSRAYIKSNYIRKAKEEWLYCDVDVVVHDNAVMLRICSITNAENEMSHQRHEDACSRVTDLSWNGAGSTIPSPQELPNNSLRILCRLSEFRSAELKPVNFRNVEKFAVKLVPAGMWTPNRKKLYLVPECEDDLTKLCGMLADHITRSKQSGSQAQIEPPVRATDNGGSVASSPSVIGTTPSAVDNSPRGHKNEEVYFALDDNDIYDGNSLESFYTVTAEDSTDARRVGLQGDYLLRLKRESLELSSIRSGDQVLEFPYVFIRRFGARGEVLRVEAGRRCNSGEGSFMFRFRDAGRAADTIRELTKQLKQGLDKEVASSVNGFDQQDNQARQQELLDDEDTVQKPPRKVSVASIQVQPLAVELATVQEESPTRAQVNIAVSSRNNTLSPPVVNSISMPTKPTLKQVTLSPPLRPTSVNTAFNRNHISAASFSYRRPKQDPVFSAVNLPVIKDDSFTGGIYDNVHQQKNPAYASSSMVRPQYNGFSRSMSGASYNSGAGGSYRLAKGRDGDTYDNVSQSRTMRDLETMLNNLGIPNY